MYVIENMLRTTHSNLGGSPGGQEDVGGFQVQVDDVAAVHLIQPSGHIHRNLATPASHSSMLSFIHSIILSFIHFTHSNPEIRCVAANSCRGCTKRAGKTDGVVNMD